MNAPHDIPRAELEHDEAIARLRTPPHAIEAEQSVLGGLLLDAQVFDVVADLLVESDFFRFEHRLIWRAIASLVLACKLVDQITVFERLQSTGDDSKVTNCLQYLNELALGVPSAANARRYAEIVRERSILRSLIAASDEIATAAFSPQGRTVQEILGQAEAKVLKIGQQGASARTTAHSMASLSTAMLDRVNELHEKGASDIVGVPTGYLDLDHKTSGLQRGDLVILAARPSMGKTALALNIAEHVAIAEDLPVIVFSMEMSASQLALRMHSSLARINGQALRTGRLADDEWGRLAEAVDRLSKSAMVIDEASALTVSDIRTRARRLVKELGGKVSLIVVDYLQLMSGGGSEENRATELGEISRNLKAMAKELDCPVIALSQLNRSVESRNDKRPVMSDLRESGAIEQDADVIFFIYRDDYYNKASREPGVAEILIAKQRSGPIGTVKLAWLSQFTRFENLALDYEPMPYAPPTRAKERI